MRQCSSLQELASVHRPTGEYPFQAGRHRYRGLNSVLVEELVNVRLAIM